MTHKQLFKIVKDSGMKQIHIAKLANIDHCHLSSVLHGRVSLTPKVESAILKILNQSNQSK